MSNIINENLLPIIQTEIDKVVRKHFKIKTIRFVTVIFDDIDDTMVVSNCHSASCVKVLEKCISKLSEKSEYE